jgi:methylphosphotriester-DNA--protein-cysteine methyltransferase
MGRLSSGENILDVGYDVGFNGTTRFYENCRKSNRNVARQVPRSAALGGDEVSASQL